MKIKTMTTIAFTAIAVLGVSAAPAQARPHHRKVCRVVHEHHHVKRICHWVG
jgi:hypothetical protein